MEMNVEEEEVDNVCFFVQRDGVAGIFLVSLANTKKESFFRSC